MRSKVSPLFDTFKRKVQPVARAARLPCEMIDVNFLTIAAIINTDQLAAQHTHSYYNMFFHDYNRILSWP